MLERFRKIKMGNDEDNLIEIHAILMRNYGFIPIEEMKKMPIPTVLELLAEIERYNRRMKRKVRK